MRRINLEAGQEQQWQLVSETVLRPEQVYLWAVGWMTFKFVPPLHEIFKGRFFVEDVVLAGSLYPDVATPEIRVLYL